MSHPYRAIASSTERPRRHVPAALQLQVLFGAGAGFYFLFWMLVGLVATTIVFSCSEPLHRPRYDRTATGFVAHVEESSSEDSYTYFVTATFNDDTGHAHEVRSYMDDTRRKGSLVDVRYQHAHPERAVIVGGRTHEMAWYVALFIVGCLGAGIGISFAATKNQRRALELLPRGELAEGKVVEHREVRDSEGTSWTTRFEFPTPDNRTSSFNVESPCKPPYAVGQTWPILFDPRRPDHATPLAHFHGVPTIGADDRITYKGSSSRLALIVSMIAACAILAVVATWAFIQWL